MLFAHACSVYRATESWATFKYGPNGDFFDLCPNHASGGRIKLWCNCFCRNPMWQQHKKKRSRFHQSYLYFSAFKENRVVKGFTGNKLTVLLETEHSPAAGKKKHCGSVCEIWLFGFDRWEFLHRGNSWTREVWVIHTSPPPSLLIIWPWVFRCWTRRQGWILRRTSWRYCKLWNTSTSQT